MLSDGDRYRIINPKFGIGFWHSGAVGDVNNDGLADLLLVTTSKGNNTLAVQKPDGTFKKHTLPLGFSSDVKRVVAGEIIDVDEDGNHDINISSEVKTALQNMHVILGRSNSTFLEIGSAAGRLAEGLVNHLYECFFGKRPGTFHNGIEDLATKNPTAEKYAGLKISTRYKSYLHT